ncbi:MAG: ATP-binding protein [Elusimicrobiota bacterium]
MDKRAFPDSRDQVANFRRQVAVRFAAIYLPALLLLGGLVAFFYFQERSRTEWMHKQGAISVADMQEDVLGREFDSITSDLMYLAEHKGLREFLTKRSPEARRALTEEFLLFCATKRGLYDQIRLLDGKGRETVRVNYEKGSPRIVPDRLLQDKSRRYYFRSTIGLDQGEVYVSPFDLNIERGEIERPWKPMIRFAVPVFDGRQRKSGVLILNFQGAKFLHRMDGISAHFPGFVMLVNDNGYWLRGPKADDDWGFMFDKEPTFKRDYPDAWRRISSSDGGQFLNSEGLFTFINFVPPFRFREAAGDRSGGLKVVSFVPHSVLRWEPWQALRRPLLICAVAAVILAALALLLANSRVIRRRDQQKLRESEARMRALSTRLITVQEDERRKISQDLHDDLGQTVTAIGIDLERAALAAEADKRDDLLRRALACNREVLDKIRELSSELRPRILDDLGLRDAVRSFLADFQTRTGIDVAAELSVGSGEVPSDVSGNIYRILQESLNNVVKHARAKKVSIRLDAAPDRVALTVRDEGVGFTPDEAGLTSLGILGMRERAELLGGRFELTSRPGEGTEILAAFPLNGGEGKSDRMKE